MDTEKPSGEGRVEEAHVKAEIQRLLTEKASRERRVEEEPPPVSRSSPLAETSNEERSILEGLVADRMNELHRTQAYLAGKAQKYARYSARVKASVIILGALVAAKEIISVMVGTSTTISILAFALAGVLIAVLTGLEASFGWGTKSGKLAALAATCRATRQRAELDRAHISSKKNAEAMPALETLLDKLMTQLQEIREETIGFGLNPVEDIATAV